MALSLDPDAITHGIQLALAPVFLLTAVAAMIGAVAGRLARIIDRARLVEERALDGADPARIEGMRAELRTLRQRGRLSNACIALLTFCALLIGLTIILLFLGETTGFASARWAVGSFLLGVGSFLLALLCFLAETFIATRLLDFPLLRVDGR